VSQSSDSTSGLDFCSLPSEVLDLVACVLAQQGFLFSSARIVCVGFSRSAATGLRFGLVSSIFMAQFSFVCRWCCLPSDFISAPESHAA
jgi:hypothetical protein